MEQKVVAYLRVSTKRQGESGLGLEAQREYVRAYCDRTGASVAREFVEVESGRKCDRAVLRQAIAHAKRSKAVLIIAKLDRLAGNVAFVANLMETRVQFLASDIPGANDMTIHVMAAVAEQEAKAISARTKEALAAAKARGVALGSSRAGAPQLTEEAQSKGRAIGAQATRAKAIAEYADLLPTIRAMQASGASLRAIAEALNAEGHVTRNGATWTSTQVLRVARRAA